MATASPPAGQPDLRPATFGVRMQRFWQRVTEGLEVSQLWSQFEAEARASYRLYSRDVEAKTPEGLTHGGRRLHVVKEFFWAVFEKLSPARRVLLLAGADFSRHPACRHRIHRPVGQSPGHRVRSSLLGGAAAAHRAHARDRRPRGDEARPADRARDPDLASPRRSAADSRPGCRLRHSPRQHRCRRLLRRLPAPRPHAGRKSRRARRRRCRRQEHSRRHVDGDVSSQPQDAFDRAGRRSTNWPPT